MVRRARRLRVVVSLRDPGDLRGWEVRETEDCLVREGREPVGLASAGACGVCVGLWAVTGPRGSGILQPMRSCKVLGAHGCGVCKGLRRPSVLAGAWSCGVLERRSTIHEELWDPGGVEEP